MWSACPFRAQVGVGIGVHYGLKGEPRCRPPAIEIGWLSIVIVGWRIKSNVRFAVRRDHLAGAADDADRYFAFRIR